MILLKLKENLLLYVRKKIILITFPQISSDLRRVLRLYKKTKKIDITYLVKQNGTVKVIAENYKYSRTSHVSHKDGTLDNKFCVPKDM